MPKEEIVINLSNHKIIEKTVSGFGNSAHIVISKEYLGRVIKIITGKSKILGNRLRINLFNNEILERKSSKFGTGAHVIIPREYLNQKVKIIIKGGENEKSK